MSEPEEEDWSSETGENAGAARTLDAQFLGREHTFRGIPLWPYTTGVDLLFKQVTSREDKGITFWLKFIFLHLKRRGKTAREDRVAHLRPLAWDTKRFENEFCDWVETLGALTDELVLEASNLFDAMQKEARLGAVDALPPDGKTRGKKKGKSPAKSPSSSASSRKSGG